VTTLRDIKLTVRALLRDKEAKKSLNRKAGARRAAITRRQKRAAAVNTTSDTTDIYERSIITGRREA